MDEKLALLVKIYRDLLPYFPEKIKPTVLDYNGKCIKISRNFETNIPNPHLSDEPYTLVFYSVYAGDFGNCYIGQIAICEDEPDVGFFPDENK